MVAVVTLDGSKPGLRLRRWTNVRTSRPALTSSTTPIATSPTTSRLRARRPRPPATARVPDSASAACTSTRLACSAGTRPKTTLVTSATSSVIASTRHVELHGIAERKHVGAQLDERAQHAPADDEAERAAAERQQRALDQQLPDDGAPSAAERHARGDLARARARAREQQPGDVDAGDEQHEADGAPQHEERLADVGRLLLLQRHERALHA